MGRNLPIHIIYHVVLRECSRSVRGFEREDKASDNGIIKITGPANRVNHIKQSSSPISLCTIAARSPQKKSKPRTLHICYKAKLLERDKCRICSKKIYCEGKKNLVL